MLTEAEHRVRHPTYFDKIGNGRGLTLSYCIPFSAQLMLVLCQARDEDAVSVYGCTGTL